MKVTSEGDVSLSDDSIHGLGTAVTSFLMTSFFGAIAQIVPHPADSQQRVLATPAVPPKMIPSDLLEEVEVTQPEKILPTLQEWSVLTQYVPDPGYFLAGGLSGVASRTTTAPLDRLKVYLIAQTGPAEETAQAVMSGEPAKATQKGVESLSKACKQLWAAGGIRSLFAGMSRDHVKLMTETDRYKAMASML